jgi:hypothetical protein
MGSTAVAGKNTETKSTEDCYKIHTAYAGLAVPMRIL